MATVNPYDRREQEKRRREARERREAEGLVDVSGGYHFDLLADGRAAYPGFTLGKLEELLRDEYARGYNCGEGTLERKTEEEILPRVRRQVWAEGHATGHGDGQHDLLNRIAEQYEDRVKSAVVDAQQLLADEGAKAEQLRPLLSLTCRVLGELIESHHNDFAPPALF
jgi:hypothetical protein